MLSGSLIIYCSLMGEGPLAWCIGRVLVGVEMSLGYGLLSSFGVFGMSVEIAGCWFGTGLIFSGRCR